MQLDLTSSSRVVASLQRASDPHVERELARTSSLSANAVASLQHAVAHGGTFPTCPGFDNPVLLRSLDRAMAHPVDPYQAPRLFHQLVDLADELLEMARRCLPPNEDEDALSEAVAVRIPTNYLH